MDKKSNLAYSFFPVFTPGVTKNGFQVIGGLANWY